MVDWIKVNICFLCIMVDSIILVIDEVFIELVVEKLGVSDVWLI